MAKTLAELIVDSARTGKIPTELEVLETVGSDETIASGTPVTTITAPTGGTTIDTEARATIDLIIAALAEFKITS